MLLENLPDSEIWDQACVHELLMCDGRCVVGLQPGLDGCTLVGVSISSYDRICHYNLQHEQTRDDHFDFLPNILHTRKTKEALYHAWIMPCKVSMNLPVTAEWPQWHTYF